MHVNQIPAPHVKTGQNVDNFVVFIRNQDSLLEDIKVREYQ